MLLEVGEYDARIREEVARGEEGEGARVTRDAMHLVAVQPLLEEGGKGEGDL